MHSLTLKPRPNSRVQHHQRIAQGIVYCMPMLEASKNLTRDFGPRRLHMAVTGTPTFVNEQFGAAAKGMVGGVPTTYLSTTFNATTYGITKFSISMRFRRDGSVNNNGLFNWSTAYNDGFPWILCNENPADTTKVRWYFNGNYRISVTTAIGPWIHHIVSYDGTTYSLYVDGVLAGTYVGGSGTNYANATNLWMLAGFGEPFEGYQDHLTVWDRPLEPWEALELTRDPFCFLRPERRPHIYATAAIPPPAPPDFGTTTMAGELAGSDISIGNRDEVTKRFNFVWSDIDGDVQFDDTQAHAVVTSVIEKKRGYWADPTHGSELHRLMNLTSRTPSQAEAMTLEAVSGLENDRLISEVKVRATIKRQENSLPIDLNWTTPTGAPASVKVDL